MKRSRSFTYSALAIAMFVASLCSLTVAAETRPMLSHKELKTLLATANTRTDHQKLATYYHDRAQSLRVKAQEFSEEAARYANQPATMQSKQGISCLCPAHFQHFAKLYAREAEESEVLAARHEKIEQEYLTSTSNQQK